MGNASQNVASLVADIDFSFKEVGEVKKHLETNREKYERQSVALQGARYRVRELELGWNRTAG
eukprot:11105596-Alexandrium_andersonii.AAC.1